MTPAGFSSFLRAIPVVRLSLLFRWLVGFSLAAGGVYGAVCINMGAGARASFTEAEGFRYWFENPAARDRALEADYVNAHRGLSLQQGRGELTAEGLRLEQDILEARFSMRRAESPAKRAYFAYRDVYRLYAPPETDLSRRARLLAPAAKHAWREESVGRGWPVTDVMFDPEPGETAGRRVVFSTPHRFEAANLAAILRGKGISADTFDDGQVPGAARQGVWITVSSDDFWRAHAQLKSLLAPDLPVVFQKS
jgi:hypothetical protein